VGSRRWEQKTAESETSEARIVKMTVPHYGHDIGLALVRVTIRASGAPAGGSPRAEATIQGFTKVLEHLFQLEKIFHSFVYHMRQCFSQDRDLNERQKVPAWGFPYPDFTTLKMASLHTSIYVIDLLQVINCLRCINTTLDYIFLL
jgi:hypothetical protein